MSPFPSSTGPSGRTTSTDWVRTCVHMKLVCVLDSPLLRAAAGGRGGREDVIERGRRVSRSRLLFAAPSRAHKHTERILYSNIRAWWVNHTVDTTNGGSEAWFTCTHLSFCVCRTTSDLSSTTSPVHTHVHLSFYACVCLPLCQAVSTSTTASTALIWVPPPR